MRASNPRVSQSRGRRLQLATARCWHEQRAVSVWHLGADCRCALPRRPLESTTVLGNPPVSLFSVMLNARAGGIEPQATGNFSQAAGSQPRAAALVFPRVMELADMTVGASCSPAPPHKPDAGGARTTTLHPMGNFKGQNCGRWRDWWVVARENGRRASAVPDMVGRPTARAGDCCFRPETNQIHKCRFRSYACQRPH